MAEKTYLLSAADSAYSAVLIGLSGIVKRIRYIVTASFNIADSNIPTWYLFIRPESNLTTVTDKCKFLDMEKHQIPADNVSVVTRRGLVSIDTNFYVDKLDYLLFYNTTVVTASILVHLDIVPVSDKTRLYLGGEYHNQ